MILGHYGASFLPPRRSGKVRPHVVGFHRVCRCCYCGVVLLFKLKHGEAIGFSRIKF